MRGQGRLRLAAHALGAPGQEPPLYANPERSANRCCFEGRVDLNLTVRTISTHTFSIDG